MEARIDYQRVGRGVLDAMLGLEAYLRQSGLEKGLAVIIEPTVRASWRQPVPIIDGLKDHPMGV